jgi:hypothetical protein
MQSSDIPGKLVIPFAASAGGAYIRSIPVNSQIGVTDGAASLHDGFVPLNATPIAGGGVPPDIRDMNGILNEISAWTRWQCAGGPIFYDAAFSTANGGYPKGAQVLSTVTIGTVFLSIVENNTANPDVDPTNWITVGGSFVTGFSSGVGYEKRPSGIIEQWATVYFPAGGTEPLVPVSLLFPYEDATFGISITPYLLTANNRRDTMMDIVQPTDGSGFSVQYQRIGDGGTPGVDGFTWRAVGKGA